MVTHSYFEITATAPLLTLAQAKKQIKVGDDLTYEDDLIAEYIEAAQISCENFINRSIAKRNFVMQATDFSNVTFERNYDNDVITKIEYYAPGATELETLSSELYQLRKSNTVECFDIKFVGTLPELDTRDDAVIITVAQGFTASSCPTPILQAMKLKIASSYVFREDGNGNNAASNNLLRAYRKY